MDIMRGTTPTNIFKTSISLVGVVVLYLTYKQFGKTVIEKTLDDVTITNEAVTVNLSQEDTLAFVADVPVLMQIRARFPDGTAVGCKIITTTADAILKDGEI